MAFNGYDNKKPYRIEGVLTLQEPQGRRKTRFCRNIVLKTQWFQERLVIDINNKDSLIRATSALIRKHILYYCHQLYLQYIYHK